jgi:hypothetical protein
MSESQESSRLDEGSIMGQVGVAGENADYPGGVVDTRQCPGQGRRAIADGQKWLLKDVAYRYEIFICDMCALKLQRGTDNPITPHGLVE